MQIKQFFLNKTNLILIVIAIMFFGLYSSFYIFEVKPEMKNHDEFIIFNWPDSMANYYFINQYIENSEFKGYLDNNKLFKNVIHPRSINIKNNYYVPMSFLGILILYGMIGKLTFGYGIMYLTSFFAVLGGLAFYGIVKRIFDKKTAFISLLLLFTSASFWYFASFPMLHNVLFLSVLMIGIYLMLKSNDFDDYKKNVLLISSGFFIGFSVVIRSTEGLWIGLFVLLVALFYRKKFSYKQVISFLGGLFLALIILIAFNLQTYDQVLTFGYLDFSVEKQGIEKLPTEFHIQQSDHWLKNSIKLLVAPFGLELKRSFENFTNYFVYYLWPYCVAFVLGTIWLIYRKFDSFKSFDKKYYLYFIWLILTACWLIVYYGSWQLADPVVLAYNTISSSYTRYFLPLSILIIPIIAFLLKEIWQLKNHKYLIKLIVILTILNFVLFSFNLVYKTQGDGLYDQSKTISNYYELRDLVLNIIDDDSILITDRHDKLFFPNCNVVIFNLDYSIFERLEPVIMEQKIYYLTPMPDKDIEYINSRKFPDLDVNLEFKFFKNVNDELRIFELVKKEM